MMPSLRALLALALCLPGLALAEVTLPQLISDGMVLQRDTQVPVWGWADPGASVTVSFRGHDYQAETDADGRWEVHLEALEPGGPDPLTVAGENTITLQNVMVGDVWLASGQSNMELNMTRTRPLYEREIAEADYPEIRYLKVAYHYDFKAPQEDLAGGDWQAVSPDTILEFATVPYFFALALHQSQGVPIGVINASMGGSPIEAWMSEEALKEFPEALAEGKRFRDDDLVEQLNTQGQERGEQWRAERDSKDAGLDEEGEPRWAQPGIDLDDWELIDLPGHWPDADQEPVYGVWWLRKTVEVPESWAGQPVRLNLGRMVDADVTYVNGEQVGATGYQYPPRWYDLPEGVLEAGTNTIAVRLTNDGNRAEFIRDRDYQLEWNDQTLDLSGAWHYRLGAALDRLEGTPPVRFKPMGLYNGMLAPLTDFPLTGVIWYQGESNVGRAAEYAELLPTLIESWRCQWGQPDLPFLTVQLANYLEAQEQPLDSDWARLREAQAESLALPNTGLAVAIDTGEWNDIHPLDKKTVGDRLALAAREVAYGEELVASGPQFSEMKRRGRRALLTFESVGSGLRSCDGEPLQEFAIAGKDREFVRAQAEIRGDRIRVWSDAVSRPVAVRYAWADNPDRANLCNREGLPAVPFRTDDWPRE